MKINFEQVGVRYRKLIKEIYNKAIEMTDNNDMNGLWVTVSFENEARVQQLNDQFRKINKPTDVLSFPMLDIAYPQKLKEYKNEVAPDGSLYLGDIVICPKIAKMQAKYYKHSKKREIGFLALHGLLHLLGYDHIEKEDEEIMTKTSENILQSLNIKRGK